MKGLFHFNVFLSITLHKISVKKEQMKALMKTHFKK